MMVRKTVAVALVAMLLAASAVIVWRRGAGAFDQPPPLAGIAIAVGLALVGGEIAGRLAQGESIALRRRIAVAEAAVASLLAAGFAPAGAAGSAADGAGASHIVLPLAAWGLLVGFATLNAWRRLERLSAPVIGPTAPAQNAAGEALPVDVPQLGAGNPMDEIIVTNVSPAAYGASPVNGVSPSDDPLLSDEDCLADDVVQQFTRRAEPGGVHWVTGKVRVRFETGQRVTQSHIAFCPPFLATPSCEAETVAGPDAAVKVAQLLPHGVRLETRLDAPATEPSEVVIEFASQGPAA